MHKARVVSTTNTFYPKYSRGEDDQSLVGTMTYFKTNCGGTLNYFLSGKTYSVFHIWNGIVFMISGETESPELLHFELQGIKQIAYFLFGANFENHMQHNINLASCDLFHKYVDEYLTLTSQSIDAQLGIVPQSQNIGRYTKCLNNHIPASEIPSELEFVECLIFKNDEIIARQSSVTDHLCATDIFVLSLYARIEHTHPEPFQGIEFDPNYVNSTTDPSVKHRAGYFTIHGEEQRCSIASTRLAKDSPYIALFVTKNAAASERRDIVMNVLGLISVAMQEAHTFLPVPPVPLQPGLVYYSIINRNNGTIHTNSSAVGEKSKAITNALVRRASVRAVNVLCNGQLFSLWNDKLFIYCYQIHFVNSKGNILKPTDTFVVNPYEDEISHIKISESLFPNVKDVQVYECLTIYLSIVSMKDVISTNNDLINQILKPSQVVTSRPIMRPIAQQGRQTPRSRSVPPAGSE